MHFKIFVEDQSTHKMFHILLKKLIQEPHSFDLHPYKGIGNIPSNLKNPKDASKRILLENLPKILKGCGRTFEAYGIDYPAVVIVICDLDDYCLKEFRTKLLSVLNQCNPKPSTKFCIAIQESEAWLLGDINAIQSAYPHVDKKKLIKYKTDNESSEGTWEMLADLIYKGGTKTLKSKSYYEIGKLKSEWAQTITPHMDIDNNQSPSFNYFISKIRELAK